MIASGAGIEDLGNAADMIRAKIRANPEESSHHATLGFLLQTQDIQAHTGGTLQGEALAA